MPLLKFTEKDISRMQPPDKGFHKFKITNLEETINKKKDGTNVTFTLECTESAVDDRNIGRIVEPLFPTNYPTMMVDLIAAVWKLPLDEAKERIVTIQKKGEEIELQDFIGETVWNEVVDEPFENRVIRKCGPTWVSGNAEPPF